MNLSLKESLALAVQIKKKLSLRRLTDKQAVICPDFLAISEVAKILKKSKIYLGAQDAFYQPKGAFTGQISAKNLQLPPGNNLFAINIFENAETYLTGPIMEINLDNA